MDCVFVYLFFVQVRFLWRQVLAEKPAGAFGKQSGLGFLAVFYACGVVLQDCVQVTSLLRN